MISFLIPEYAITTCITVSHVHHHHHYHVTHSNENRNRKLKRKRIESDDVEPPRKRQRTAKHQRRADALQSELEDEDSEDSDTDEADEVSDAEKIETIKRKYHINWNSSSTRRYHNWTELDIYSFIADFLDGSKAERTALLQHTQKMQLNDIMYRLRTKGKASDDRRQR